MFLFDRDYIIHGLLSIGGFSRLVSDFIVQSWYMPLTGPLSISLILLSIGIFTQIFLCRSIAKPFAQVLALVPVAILYFLSYKEDYDFSNMVGGLLVSLSLALLSRISNRRRYIIAASPTFILLVFATGWPAILLTVGALLTFAEPAYKDRHSRLSPKATMAMLIGALVLVSVFMAFKSPKEQDRLFQELDWYVYKDQPDNVLKAITKVRQDNYVYENFTNWALARKGILLDDLFAYPQHNPYSLTLEWREIKYTTILLSNIYWLTGNIALSQRMAFEANVCYDNSNPRMLQRLVETNLAYGEYDVARKYLERLEKTLPYRKWAIDHKSFLYNGEAVRDDAILGSAARCIPDTNALCESKGDICWDLVKAARSNPDCSAAREYAGAWMLLKGDIQAIPSFLDEFYVGKTLPKSLAEAVMILSESHPELVEQWNLKSELVSRYEGFKALYDRNAQSPNLKQKLRREYGDTYWFYLLYFKK